jgi:hypothetical protein
LSRSLRTTFSPRASFRPCRSNSIIRTRIMPLAQRLETAPGEGGLGNAVCWQDPKQRLRTRERVLRPARPDNPGAIPKQREVLLWQTQSPPAATCHPAHTDAPSAVTSSRLARQNTCRHARPVATANMKRFQAATASKIRIPTASAGPRRRPAPTLRAAL